jgi:toxin ParE1/3/4
MRPIRFRTRALRDLESIKDYIAEHDIGAANRVAAHLMRRIQRLGKSPLIGKKTDRSGVRVVFPTKYPYRIYYLLTATEVVILHVRHSSRGDLKKRNLDE